ncbi:MAG: type IV pilus assembly protein FimV [Gammaproteobacteria bacterium]
MSKYGTPGVLATLLILLPGAAQALGLGQIQSDTRIGQTLSARILILAADANSLQGLSVGLASPAAYKQAGMREPDFLFGLKFQV